MSDNSRDDVQHSAPIAINPRATRARSASVSSYSSGSPSSPSLPPTPMSAANSSPKIGVQGGSPILSYFLAQSPTKPTGTFPFKRFGATPVFEEDEPEQEPAASAHARRASTHLAGRFAAPQPVPGEQNERGTGILRRLSIGGAAAFSRPTAEMLSPTHARTPSSPTMNSPAPSGAATRVPPTTQIRKARRSATVSTDSKPRRAPSPMGERILKGHFDGFN
ncbi:hypothetical protein BD626DRAFT_491921 [Schizophyllum amplum]|uniref:Uncharacterized protein n=1 Tax=Schizophyllum amplum TaxID=97359 RepID=A0A550CI49_9AGAR|nr:hypothetical protein BD626DRAFT_491921 [Auriculariopsis ampla]